MSKIHTTVRVGVDGSLTLPAFFMRGMGYEPGEEVPITTPANQYICDCDANRLLVTRTCDDAECTGYTSSGMELNLPAALLSPRHLSPWEKKSRFWPRMERSSSSPQRRNCGSFRWSFAACSMSWASAR